MAHSTDELLNLTEKHRKELGELCQLVDRQVHLFNTKAPAGAAHIRDELSLDVDAVSLLHRTRDPLLTHRQRYLDACFNLWGVFGLNHAMRLIAVAEDLEEARRKARVKIETAKAKRKEEKRKARNARAGNPQASGKRKRVVVSSSSSSSDEDADSDGSGTNQNSAKYWEKAFEDYENNVKTHPALVGHKSWKRAVDDLEKGVDSRLLFYNASLGPELIDSLIKGDLPSRMQDPEFKARVGPHVRLRTKPGTYVVYVGVACPTMSTQVDSNMKEFVGCGLSINQLDAVLDCMQLYINVDDPESRTLARKIDSRLPNRPEVDYVWQRRYGGGGDNMDDFQRHLAWIRHFKAEVLEPLKESIGPQDRNDVYEIPLQRCLAYAGIAQDVFGRASQHGSHQRKESPIFGLFTATVRHLYGDSFSWQDSSYQVYKTAAVEDIGLDEIGTSILTSAYPWDGGLGYVHAGDSLGNRKRWLQDTFLDDLKENAASIGRSENIQRSLDDARQKVEQFNSFGELEKSQQELIEQYVNQAREAFNHVCDLGRYRSQDEGTLTAIQQAEEDLTAQHRELVQDNDELTAIMKELGDPVSEFESGPS